MINAVIRIRFTRDSEFPKEGSRVLFSNTDQWFVGKFRTIDNTPRFVAGGQYFYCKDIIWCYLPHPSKPELENEPEYLDVNALVKDVQFWKAMAEKASADLKEISEGIDNIQW